jgi:hypothetical protein
VIAGHARDREAALGMTPAIRTVKRVERLLMADAQFHRTRNDVSSVPADPHETTIGHRPGVVLVPTIHVQLTRPPDGRLGYSPCARDGPLL